MIRVFGHEKNRLQLERELPPVSLFRGPPSVGKWTTAQYLSQFHGVLKADVREVELLNADAARDIKQFCSTAPFGERKLIVARLDQALAGSLNSLLKLLEEPPRTVSFILTSVKPTLDTIASRSHVFRFGLLPRDDLFDILVHRVGMAPNVADRAADLGRGQVQRAIMSDQQDASKASVMAVLKSIKDCDKDLLSAASQKWDESAHALLVQWCIEAITGRWQVFTESESFGLHKDKQLTRRILISLRSGARPRLAMRTGVLPLLSERR